MATVMMIESWLHSTGHALPALLHRQGHQYVLLTRDPGLYPPGADGTAHPAVRYADEVVVVETNDLAAVLAEAVVVARRHRLDGVLTTCDYYLGTVAQVARRLGLPGEDPAALALATRKDQVRAVLAAAGVSDVRHAVVADEDMARKAASELGYPVVAKPVDGNSGAGVRLSHDEAELVTAFAGVADSLRNSRGQTRPALLLLEEVLDGHEVSVESITVDGRTSILAVTDKSLTAAPRFVESGHMVPARLDPDVTRAVEEHARVVLAALGLRHGLAHTEIRLTSRGPRLVEVNPRQGGGSIFELVTLVTGHDPLDLLVRAALGESFDVRRSGRAASAAIMFVVSPEPARIVGLDGGATLDADPAVLRWHVRTPAAAPAPTDNGCYLGEVVAVAEHDGGARAAAEAAVGRLRLRTADGRQLRPLGVPSGLA